MGTRAWRAFACAATIASGLHCAPLDAADSPIVPDLPAAEALDTRMFLFGGFEAAQDTSFAWTGLVGAPHGRLDEDGARVRVMVGHGQYRYRTDAVPGGVNRGSAGEGEFMIGWRRSFEPLVLTAYLGAHQKNHRLKLPDPGNRVVGEDFGIKAAVELYARLHPQWYATASAAASSAHYSYHLRGAITHELGAGFDLGVEAAFMGDARYQEQRAGLLVGRWFDRQLVTLSGGVLRNSGKGNSPYLTLSIYQPY